MKLKLPLTIKQLKAADYERYHRNYLPYMPWLDAHEDNLSICIKTYPQYFAEPTKDQIQTIGKMPYIEYSELSEKYIKQAKSGVFEWQDSNELYLLAMARVHQQLILMKAFEGLFTGIGAYQMSSSESSAGFDFAKKYEEYAPLLNLSDGNPLLIKELEQISVEYIYLCLDYRSEKAAAEKRMIDKR